MKRRHPPAKMMPYPSLIREHRNLVKILSRSKSPSIKKLYHEQKKELHEYEEEYKAKKRRK